MEGYTVSSIGNRGSGLFEDFSKALVILAPEIVVSPSTSEQACNGVFENQREKLGAIRKI